MHRSAVLLVALVLSILAACAREPLKEAGLQGEGAIGAVRALVSAYERRSLDEFMDLVGSGFPGRDALRGQVETVFAAYQNIRYTVQYRKMLVEAQHKGNIAVTFTWGGAWSTSGGRTVTDGGRVTLLLAPATFQLLAIEGKSPLLPVAASLPSSE